jgi:hypothetical protein
LSAPLSLSFEASGILSVELCDRLHSTLSKTNSRFVPLYVNTARQRFQGSGFQGTLSVSVFTHRPACPSRSYTGVLTPLIVRVPLRRAVGRFIFHSFARGSRCSASFRFGLDGTPAVTPRGLVGLLI